MLRNEKLSDIHKKKVEAYYYVRAWGATHNWRPYEIETELDRAREDRAPSTALYLDINLRRWFLLEDLPEGEEKQSLIDHVARESGAA